MPNQNATKFKGKDPDPTDYLWPTMDQKKQNLQKPYDPKKSVWCPDPKDGGYREGILESGDLEDPASKCMVSVGHEKFTYEAAQVGKVNPPKFEMCEDMVNLTFLNDASVFNNLKTRYQAKMIHCYSGLFVCVINPYKFFPIYTHRVANIYLGKRRNEAPPHLWAIAECAYRNMLQNKKDNAMMITGESGAGKTENTKKVITYLALAASGVGGSKKKKEKKISLEDQIVATNPILESYGNAKTARNDNSSRFGKFIRIHFTATGKLAGCDIVSYLLEKSRITEQQEVERSYHIFYQLVQPYGDGIGDGVRNVCKLSKNIKDYSYVSQGKTTVESINDNEDFEFTEDAFNILGFGNQEKWECYMLTAGVLASGEIEFKTKGRDDQAECEKVGPETYPGKVAHCYGVEAPAFIKAFCKPRIKVGTEWVTKGQSCEQATNGVGGIARAIFDRLFKWLIIKCNDTLIDASLKKANFCAVLDIAGFEIFEYNGFEQICINFVNEKLQQFFNHHMFVVEQEEYVKEGIDWVMVDFGSDLQAAITMFEKPMGIWSILEEESLFPKATDNSFAEKLRTALGKMPCYLKPKSETDPDAHFGISHYAGVVNYNVTNWLEKNKDPVNETVVEILKNGTTNELLSLLWADHPGQPTEADKGEKKKKKKGGGGKTVSSVYLVSLGELMETLHACEPHFVRCLVPNTHKTPGMVEPLLIMHQLQCNGVLEGIRICMRGFPNRMLYPDFKLRYQVLGSAELASSDDNKTAVYALCDKIGFGRERYRLGHTIVFFRAGALAFLEEMRDDLVMNMLRKLQGEIYLRVRGHEVRKKLDQRELLQVAQRQFRLFLKYRDWGWHLAVSNTRKLIGKKDVNEELRLLEEKAKEVYGEYIKQKEEKARLLEENQKIEREKKEIMKQIEKEQGNLSIYHEKQARLKAETDELTNTLKDTQEQLKDAEERRVEAIESKKIVEAETDVIKKEIGEVELKIQKVQQECANRDHTIKTLNEVIENNDQVINKLNKEKKYLQETVAKAAENLHDANEKVSHLNNVKNKLENTLDDLEGCVEKEKKDKLKIDKERRKKEGDLKIAQEVVADLERQTKELEAHIARKDTELHGLGGKLDEEQAAVSRVQSNIKEAQGRIEELEEELEAERQARSKAERQRSDLSRTLDGMTDRLAEASDTTNAQVELNKKREAEVAKLRKDIEECKIQFEAVIIGLQKKQQDSVAEMGEQIEQLQKMKSKIDKDKALIINETSEVRAASDEVVRSKNSAEKKLRELVNTLAEIKKKVEIGNLNIANYESNNKKLSAENADLLKNLQILEGQCNLLAKTKSGLAHQLDEMKGVADHEANERGLLLGKYRNLEHIVDGLKENLNDETVGKDNVAHQLHKAQGEADLWRKRYETDGLAKVEEMEMSKVKMAARLNENQNLIEQLSLKMSQVDKRKHKLQQDVSDMSSALDQAQIMNSAMEKKAKQYDRIVGEWKHKVDGLGMDLEMAQNETRTVSAELFKAKNAYEESVIQLDEVRRENKALSIEIKDIMDSITEGGRSIHEIDKIRKRLEAEKLELEAALSEAEGVLEQTENKVLRAAFELEQVKKEIARRVDEKEIEFANTRKNYSKAVDGMQVALESETKSKVELSRIKKKLEADVLDLTANLEHANASNTEAQKNIKRISNSIRDMQTKFEDENHAKTGEQDRLLTGERKANSLNNNLEEFKTLLEQADRNRRMLEQELADTNETLSELTCANQSINGAKQKCENEVKTIGSDLDEMSSEAHMSEEKAKRAMVDAARLANELRCEQDAAMSLERENKLLEAQIKDAQVRCDEAEQNALKGGKKAISTMESRIRELESELNAENRRFSDGQKNLRKTERTIKELTYTQEEDRKNHERMQGLIDNLQQKIKSYKKQIEEAETIAALNLSKFKQVQVNLSVRQDEADAVEHAAAQEAPLLHHDF